LSSRSVECVLNAILNPSELQLLVNSLLILKILVRVVLRQINARIYLLTIFCNFLTLSSLTRELANVHLRLHQRVILSLVGVVLAVVEVILGQGKAAQITFIYCL
jgi:hypothetical protein